jgi:hypothetical protein
VQIDCSCNGLCHVIVRDLIFHGEACKPVGVSALCCCSGTCLEAVLVCSMDERAEVQPSLVGMSQSSMSSVYIQQCVRRLITFINSCSSVYGTFAMIAIFGCIN